MKYKPRNFTPGHIRRYAAYLRSRSGRRLPSKNMSMTSILF